jgi:hypothetical protein
MVTDETAAAANVWFGGGPPRLGRRRAPVPRRGALGALGALALLGACVRTTTVTYLPNLERPRLTLAQGEVTLARYLGIECESLLGRSVATGDTRVAVVVDSLGGVTASELERSTGDARADGLVGAVTAQLRLDGLPAGTTRAVVRAGYRCDPAGGATATLVHP